MNVSHIMSNRINEDGVFMFDENARVIRISNNHQIIYTIFTQVLEQSDQPPLCIPECNCHKNMLHLLCGIINERRQQTHQQQTNSIDEFVNGIAPCMLGNFACFLSSADFFQNHFFRKTLSGIPSECQTVWIQTRPDILSGLIWVQTVCKR